MAHRRETLFVDRRRRARRRATGQKERRKIKKKKKKTRIAGNWELNPNVHNLPCSRGQAWIEPLIFGAQTAALEITRFSSVARPRAHFVPPPSLPLPPICFADAIRQIYQVSSTTLCPRRCARQTKSPFFENHDNRFIDMSNGHRYMIDRNQCIYT